MSESIKKETEYKQELFSKERNKADLRREAEELKNKTLDMNQVLGARDTQMTKIDEKINELIRLRKEIAQGRD